MNARSSWGARTDRRSDEDSSKSTEDNPDLRLEDLLDARFDEEGHLSQIGTRGADPTELRPPAQSAEELEQAVKKLSDGLQAIERQGRVGDSARRKAAGEAQEGDADRRSFVTYSLDRLEARLEALSQRLQQRDQAHGEGTSDAQMEPSSSPSLAAESEPRGAAVFDWQPENWGSEPSLAVAPDAALPLTEDAGIASEMAADVAAEEQRLLAEEQRLLAEAAELRRRRAEAEEARRRQRAEEARRRAEAEEARRQAEEARRQAEEARRQAEAEEARRRAAVEEAERRAALVAARREAETQAEMKRQFRVIEDRIDELQRNFDDNQIEPVRQELHELLQRIQELGRDGRARSDAVEKVYGRLDDMDAKLNAARNMAGNRLGDIHDRLSGLTDRLSEIEVEIPGFDAVRVNQGAILERFDRMEGLVERVAAPTELLDRVEGLRRQLQSSASQEDVTRIGEQINVLVDRIEALPEALAGDPVLARIEANLQALGEEFVEARRQRKSAESDLDQRLAALTRTLHEIAESNRSPDLSGIDERLSDIGGQLEADRRVSGDALARLDRRLVDLTSAVEAQEKDAAAEILSGLTQRIESLGEAIEAQDSRGARRDIASLDRKFDQLAGQLGEQSQHLSRREMGPLEARLDVMQAQLEELSRRTSESTGQFGPFAQKLQEISDRVSALGAAGAVTPLSQRLSAIEERIAGFSGKGPDLRSLHTQLEGIVSRLELLKGRSIDPARLNDLFDRVDAAIHALPEHHSATVEHLARGDRVGVPDERFARLEAKLEELGRASQGSDDELTHEDLAELRSDITALRRELRSLPAVGEGEGGFGESLRRLSEQLAAITEDRPATAAELDVQIERIAQMLDDPRHSRLALAHIETSLKGIEERLDETRRSLASGAAGGVDGLRTDADLLSAGLEPVAGLARSLSDDVAALKAAPEASDKKTSEALDAVQDTLEAVVKRMAFLERDAERTPAAAELRPQDSVRTAPEPEPVQAAVWDEPAEPAERPDQRGGILGRLTSSQLLKRATGGRAESFSPEVEEPEEADDLPLEPGTDAPLSSALSEAPSSDTALMSGARSRARLQPQDGRAAALRGAETDAADDDFLAAARRAARTAAAEASEDEDDLGAESARGPGGGLGTRHKAILAGAFAVAIAFAAVQIIRGEFPGMGAIDFADLPWSSAPSESPASRSQPTENVAVAPAVEAPPAVPAAESAPATGSASTTSNATPGGAFDPAEDIAAVESTAAPAASPPAQSAEDSASTSDEVAALSPPAETEGPTPSMAPTPGPSPIPLPDEIGPPALREAASAGDALAAFEVATRFAEGALVPQDMAAAARWYERAADGGIAPAQYRLGSIYEKGTGVERDLERAQHWYRLAADAGNVKAMHNLAVLYAEGAGGEPDLEAAAELFRDAAEHGVRDSQFNLAILHARGLGVPQDLIEAYKWFAVAASSGDEESAKRRDIIAAALAEPDLAKAEAAAVSFQPIPLIADANEVIMPEGGWGEDASVEFGSGPALVSESIPPVETNLQSENDLVALVQKLLAEKGFDPGPADGLLGEQTIEAITNFQRDAGLPTTGQIDTPLVTALQERST